MNFAETWPTQLVAEKVTRGGSAGRRQRHHFTAATWLPVVPCCAGTRVPCCEGVRLSSRPHVGTQATRRGTPGWPSAPQRECCESAWKESQPFAQPSLSSPLRRLPPADSQACMISLAS